MIAELINVKNFDTAFLKLEETSVQFRENGMEAENDICSPIKIHDTCGCWYSFYAGFTLK